MKKQLTSTFIALLTFLSFAVSAEKVDTNVSVAEQYLAAYKVFDLDKMGAFYTDDAVFIDPTSEVFGEHNYHMQGKDAILKKLGTFVASSGPIVLDFDMQTQFEVAGYAVYQAKLKVSAGEGDKFSTGCGHITTVITVKNGKVSEHRDYFDYKSYGKTAKKGDQDCSAIL